MAKHKIVREGCVRVSPDSRDGSKDYWLTKSEAEAQYNAGKLFKDLTNSSTNITVYMPAPREHCPAPSRPQSSKKGTMNSHELQAVLDRAEHFITQHLVTCCKEAVDFQTSGILGSGRIREAARIYAGLNPTTSLKMALDEVARQAMQRVAKVSQVKTKVSDRESATYWTRKCQECGNRQAGSEPTLPISDAYRNAKCRSCRSESLDYGSGGWVKNNGIYTLEETK